MYTFKQLIFRLYKSILNDCIYSYVKVYFLTNFPNYEFKVLKKVLNILIIL